MKKWLLAIYHALIGAFQNQKDTVEKPVEKPVEMPTTHEENIYEKFYRIASEEIGEKEYVGLKNNPRVLEYHAATVLASKQDATPWCSAFVCWVIEKAGVRSTRDAWARSYMDWGVHLEDPVKGCIVVFRRGYDTGHVAFFHSADEDNIYVLGGNQGDEVCVKPYLKSNFLGFRGVK